MEFAETTVEWHGPFSFYPGSDCEHFKGSCCGEQPGVYLWTLRFSANDRLHYAGKTSDPMQARLADELAFSFDGKTRVGEFKPGPLVDFDLLINEGIRKVEIEKPTVGQLQAAHDRIHKCMQTLRIFMAPLHQRGEKDFLKRVESSILRHSYSTCPQCRSTMYTTLKTGKPPISKRPPKFGPRLKLQMVFHSGASVCGLEGCVEEKDWHDYR